MMRYEDRFWTSQDGLKLHYREYPAHEQLGGGDTQQSESALERPSTSVRPPIICLPGLTRNAHDFEALAEQLSPEWRVLCLEMRGRGDSEYARDANTYNPAQYAQDVTALLDALEIERFVAIGTSLGGLITMLLALQAPDRIAGAVINDVGPYLEPAGVERIKSYVGQGRSFPTWVHAARGLEEMQGTGFPGRDLPFWIAAAKRVMTLSSNARIVFDYDMKIAEPFARIDPSAAQVDMWPALDALDGKPALIVRGALSDLLGEQTLSTMLERLPQAESVTIANIGHAPTLCEPEAFAAIERLLAKVD